MVNTFVKRVSVSKLPALRNEGWFWKYHRSAFE